MVRDVGAPDTPVHHRPGFARWFAQSKIVDEQSRPLVVYHGTTEIFDVFEMSDSGFYGAGAYFTDCAEAAETFAADRGDGEPIVLAVHLSLQNPYVFEAPCAFQEPTNVSLARELLSGSALHRLVNKLSGKSGHQWYNPTLEFRRRLEQRGYDGLVVHLPNEPSEYVAFQAAQIKSIQSHRFNASDPRFVEPAQRARHALQGNSLAR